MTTLSLTLRVSKGNIQSDHGGRKRLRSSALQYFIVASKTLCSQPQVFKRNVILVII